MSDPRLAVWLACQVGIARTEVVRAAVELIGARTGLGSHDCRNRLAQLRVVVLRGDLGFRHRIHWRIDDDDAQNRILVIGAIQLECGSAESLTVYLNLLRTLRVFIRCVRPAEKLCARKQKLKVGEVLVAHRKTRDLLLIEDCCNVRFVCLQFRLCVCVHFYGCAGVGTYVHRRIDARRGVGLDLDALGLEGTEPLGHNFHDRIRRE